MTLPAELSPEDLTLQHDLLYMMKADRLGEAAMNPLLMKPSEVATNPFSTATAKVLLDGNHMMTTISVTHDSADYGEGHPDPVLEAAMPIEGGNLDEDETELNSRQLEGAISTLKADAPKDHGTINEACHVFAVQAQKDMNWKKAESNR